MFRNKNYWKEGFADKWTFERSKHWNGWIWVRKTKAGTLVGKSSKTFARKEWCENHAKAFGLNGNSKKFPWAVEGSKLLGWSWIVEKDGKIFQSSHRSWKSKKDCYANAARHGLKK